MQIRLLIILLMGLLSFSHMGAAELRIDGWESGQAAGFQGGFVSEEIAAVRLDPGEACPCAVTGITFLFGGATDSREVVLRIWDDSGQAVPGAERFRRSYQVTGANDALQFIDLSADGIFVTGPFRVGIEMTESGFPAPARDTDGDISAAENFIFASGLGWLPSNLLGLTGDWIIRATVEEQGQLPQEFKNDSWPPTVAATFQGGFVAGEMAAIRVVPEGPCPCTINGVSLLFGGGTGTHDAVLRIWEDDGLSVNPGSEIFNGVYSLVGADAAINLIDLSTAVVVVNGPFRFGFELSHDGFPGVARDDDGITANSNFINAVGLGWVESSTLGVTGDWIMRAVLTDAQSQVSELGNDNWAPIETAAFQEGFVSGEIAASRIERSFECPCRVDTVRLLLGGNTATTDVTLRIWEDEAGTNEPGLEVYSASVPLTGSDLTLNTIDLTDHNIWVNSDQIRIGVEFTQGGLPSIARDHDGVLSGRNYIRRNDGSWVDATTQGVTGDWILRAVIQRDNVARLGFE